MHGAYHHRVGVLSSSLGGALDVWLRRDYLHKINVAKYHHSASVFVLRFDSDIG